MQAVQPSTTPSDPPSILALAHSLHASLSSTFAPLLPHPSHLLHPLGPIPPSSLSKSRAQLNTTLTSLHAACAAFSNETLALVPDSSIARGPARAASEKYLSLLKESAASQSVLLEAEEDKNRRTELLRRRGEYEVNLPLLERDLLRDLPGAERSLGVLERIAKGLGLDCFKDEPRREVRESGEVEVHTLSVGGKAMVVDFEVDGTSGGFERVKFTYHVLEDQHEDEEVARRLQSNLGGMDGSAEEAGLESALVMFRESLRELKVLDEMTAASNVDCFAVANKMGPCLREILEAEGSTMEQQGHGIFRSDSNTSRPSILYHATPSAQLAPEWTSATEQLFSNASMVSLKALGGVHTLDVTLEEPAAGVIAVESYMGQGDAPTSEEESPSFEQYFQRTGRRPHLITASPTFPTFLAKFSPPAPITKATGRRILKVLGTQVDSLDSNESKSDDLTWIEDLMISKVEGKLSKFDKSDSYQVVFDDAPLTQSYSLAQPGSIPGYLCSDIRFQSPSQLFRIIEIMREQHTFNDLLQSVLTDDYRVVAPPPLKGGKRRKLDVLSISDLFSDETRSKLPIFLHLHTTTSPPSLSISFPSPHTSASTSFPISIDIKPDSTRESGLSVLVNCTANEAVVQALDSERAENVLTLTRDLGLLMRWVMKRLNKLGQGDVDME